MSSSTSSSVGVSGSKSSEKLASTDAHEMSESYHEIFDSVMPPPEAIKTRSLVDQTKESLNLKDDHVEDDVVQLAANDVGVEDALHELVDENTASTTRYLTSKLVEDSLRWQVRKLDSTPTTPSPLSSPSHRRPQNLSPFTSKPISPSSESIVYKYELDPTAILDIERSAKHLATSVDELSETLGGVLQGISALTVETIETYRDGVCKTCDEVDANIKSMYQLMAKVEELNKSMAPAYSLGERVYEVKRLLDTFEAAFNSK